MNKKRRTAFFYRKWRNYALESRAVCSECGEKLFYIYRYDTDFCPQCNKWLNEGCNDPNCMFCSERPETPEIALAECNELFDYEQSLYSFNHNFSKERAIRRYSANERHKKRRERLSRYIHKKRGTLL